MKQNKELDDLTLAQKIRDEEREEEMTELKDSYKEIVIEKGITKEEKMKKDLEWIRGYNLAKKEDLEMFEKELGDLRIQRKIKNFIGEWIKLDYVDYEELKQKLKELK